MPPTHTDEGLRAALEAGSRRPGLPILVLSQYVEEQYATELIGGGAAAVGYLLKERVARRGGVPRRGAPGGGRRDASSTPR